jgi:hypothetical protein
LRMNIPMERRDMKDEHREVTDMKTERQRRYVHSLRYKKWYLIA